MNSIEQSSKDVRTRMRVFENEVLESLSRFNLDTGLDVDYICVGTNNDGLPELDVAYQIGDDDSHDDEVKAVEFEPDTIIDEAA